MQQQSMIDRHGAFTGGAVVDAHARALEASRAAGLDDAYRDWMESNWPIWDGFCKLADLMRLKGRTYYSARAVLHVLRWERALNDPTDRDFKINNKWSARMARTYNAMHNLNFFQERDRHG